MTFGDAMYALGNAIQNTFPVLKSLKNSPNAAFITVLALLFVWWCWKMLQYDKEAKQTGAMQ